MKHLKTLLGIAGYRLTRPRQRLFALLEHAEQPLSLRSIHEKLPTIDRVSIYRTLELYQRLGITRTIHVGWKKQYELAEPFKPHHHHLQCTQCGELIDIETPTLENLVSDIANRYGYTLTSHHFELEGVCRQCRS